MNNILPMQSGTKRMVQLGLKTLKILLACIDVPAEESGEERPFMTFTTKCS